MTYENAAQTNAAISHELATVVEAQRKADVRALLNGGMPVLRKITLEDNGHRGAPKWDGIERPRPQNATGLLATDYALDDYNTWK